MVTTKAATPRRPKAQATADSRAVAQAARQGRKTYDQALIPGFPRFVQITPSFDGMSFTRDTRPDEIPFHVYDEMRRDGHLSAGLTLVKAPILGRLKAAHVEGDDPAVNAVVEKVFLESGLFYKLGQTSFRALDFGVAFHELEWEAADLEASYTENDDVTGEEVETQAWSGPGLWPKAFHEVNPSTVAAIVREPKTRSYAGFLQKASPKEIPVAAINSFVYTHDGEWGNYWGTPKTKPAYPYYFWKQATMKFWMHWVENKADPPRIVKYPPGKQPDGTNNADLAIMAAVGLTNQSSVAIPSELLKGSTNTQAWELGEIKVTDTSDIFLNTKHELDTEMLLAIFAPERTFSPNVRGTGTYSEAKEHVDVFLLTEDALQEDWIECVNHYAVRRVIELNFGPDAAESRIVLPGITDEERDARRMLFGQLIQSHDPSLGGVVDLKELAERENVPVVEGQPVAPVAPAPDGAAPSDTGQVPAAVPQTAFQPQVGPQPNLEELLTHLRLSEEPRTPRRSQRTVERDDDGRIARVIEEEID